jgi:hypothetical protein
MKTLLFSKRIILPLVMVLTVFGLVATWLPSEAQAHGRKTIVNGKYQIVFGLLNEPVYVGNQSGVDLTVCVGTCENNADGTLKNPVKDLDKTLKAEVIYGSQKLPVTLKPRFRADGKYDGIFFPSRAGDYSIRLFGTVNGDQVDETVAPKDGYGAVEDRTALQFPAGAASGGSVNLEQQVKEAKDGAASATTFGIIGLVVGGLGLLAGIAGVALAMRRSGAATSSADAREAVGSGTRQDGLGG